MSRLRDLGIEIASESVWFGQQNNTAHDPITLFHFLKWKTTPLSLSMTVSGLAGVSEMGHCDHTQVVAGSRSRR